jgi:hypothetical protein
MRKCEIQSCDKEHRARGMCIDHYNNWVRFGSTLSREDQIRNDAIDNVIESVHQIAKRENLDAVSVARVVELLEFKRA